MESENVIGPGARAKIEALREEHGSLGNVAQRLKMSYPTLVAILLNRRRIGIRTALLLRDGLGLAAVDDVFR